MLCLELSLAGHGFSDTNQKFISLQSNHSECINIHKDQDYILNIGMRRKNKSSNLKAHCPMFHKGKDEGWFLVLGSIQNRELLALKRVSGISGERKCHQLQFTAPSDLGNFILL